MKNQGCLILPLLLLACKVSAQTAAIDVRVYDYTGLQPSTLQKLVTQTQDILAGTGASIQVKLCRGGSVPPCEAQTTARILVLRIVPGEAKKMRNVRRLPLGQSFSDEDGGTYASVFLERVQDEAGSANVPWVTVLAFAAAHEVGHLLLGPSHTPSGLMKAAWDRNDYQAMNQKHLHFSEVQIRELRSR